MKIVSILFFTCISLFFSSCGSSNTSASDLFEIQLNGEENKFQQHEKVTISLKNKKNISIENVSYSIDGEAIAVTDNTLELNIPKLGNKTIKATINYEGKSEEISKSFKLLSANAPEIYTYEILNEFPHDQKAFTQGLEFYKDTLYESTGRNGQSSLRKVDYKTGKILKKVDLDKTYFGEGITILNDKIYMLTWQSGLGFIYDVKNLDKIDSFKYGASKQGWGFANNGQKLYKSDGTEKIWIINPDNLTEETHIETVTNKSIFNKTNELEYVDGKLYANVWQKESMMIIDASSGAIEGVINFGGLKNNVTKHDDLDVLNGVAYNKQRGTFFVTGKNWDKLFEVKIMKK